MGPVTKLDPPTAHPPAHSSDDPTGRNPLEACARRTERFVAASGWNQPPRLFSLVGTARLLAAEPQLTGALGAPAAGEISEQISSIEQEGWIEQLGRVNDLDGLFAALAWPPEVDGAALAIERAVAPHGELDPAAPHPDDPSPAEVRLFVAVLRDGSGTCLLRQRAHDADHLVASGPEIAPTLLDALAGTLRAE